MTDLTPEQEAVLANIRASWLDDWKSCAPLDRSRVEDAITSIYADVEQRPAPKFVYVASPADAIATSLTIRNNLRVSMWSALVAATEVRTEMLFQENAAQRVEAAFSFLTAHRNASAGMDLPKDTLGINFHYANRIGRQPAEQNEVVNIIFARKIGIAPEQPPIDINETIARHIWFFYPFKDACIIVERPESIVLDDTLRFHNLSGPVIRWRDGTEAFAVRGTFIPPRWIRDKDSITIADALDWPNAEQRRIAAELIGWQKVLDQIGTTVVDENKNPEIGTLLRADLPNRPGALFLKVRCGTGRTFILPVPDGMTTALQANAWTYNVSEETLLNLEART